MIPSVHSGRLRAASVSSIRSTNVPWRCSAYTQLNSADRAPPTWNIPVGEGAKRTRTVTPFSLRAPVTWPTRGLPAGSGSVAFVGGRKAMLSRRQVITGAVGVAAGSAVAGCAGDDGAPVTH